MTDLRISGASSNPRSESDISLNHGDPNKIIAAANDLGMFHQAVFFSTDGGTVWNSAPAGLPLAPGDTSQTDPAVDWTSDGTAWAATLGVHVDPDSQHLIMRLRTYTSVDGGQTWSLDATPSGTETDADREIMWVDHSSSSPFKDQIYVTYHGGSQVFVVRRTAGAGGAWQTPVQVRGTGAMGTPTGGDIKTNSFGDVFVFWPFWPDMGTNKILVAKSTNGGVSFEALGSAPVTIGGIFAIDRHLSIPAFPFIMFGSRGARVYISGGGLSDSDERPRVRGLAGPQRCLGLY